MECIQKAIRRQQKIDELCSAIIRAVSGQSKLQYHAGTLSLEQRRIPIFAAHLQIQSDKPSFAVYRGISDAISLRAVNSDEDLHRSLCPDKPLERLIFELLEQLRVESLVPTYLPGMKKNLQQCFIHWSMQFHYSGMTENALGILLYSLAQICWARLNNCQVLEQTEDIIEATRAGIVPLIGHDLLGLKKHKQDQQRFAVHARSMASLINNLVELENQEQNDEADSVSKDIAMALQRLMDFDESDAIGSSLAHTGNSKVFQESEGGYRIFSTQYDAELPAANLARPVLVKELREKLDKIVLAQGINMTRLTRQLRSIFTVPERAGWSFGEEEGYIDGSRLSQLLSSPAETRLFRKEKYSPQANTMVSFLIDCSGSMKAYMESIAVLIDVFARALELTGVSTTISGFSTGGWNGGRVLNDWMAKGRPQNPGRLNEVNYIIYKDADTRWRRSRANIALLLKPDLFREGIDGEAVAWACQRLLNCDVQRRVLIVLSDGSPMDTATNLANDKYYLDNHLKEVIGHYEQQGEVDIYGLGVGLDLSSFYKQSLVMDLSNGLSNEVFSEILQLLSRQKR